MISYDTGTMIYALFLFIVAVITAYAMTKTDSNAVLVPMLLLCALAPLVFYYGTYTTYTGWESQNNIFLSGTETFVTTYLDDSGYHTHTILGINNAYAIRNHRLYNIAFEAQSVTINGQKARIFTYLFGGYGIPLDGHSTFSIDGETFTQATVTVYPTKTDSMLPAIIIFSISSLITVFAYSLLKGNEPETEANKSAR